MPRVSVVAPAGVAGVGGSARRDTHGLERSADTAAAPSTVAIASPPSDTRPRSSALAAAPGQTTARTPSADTAAPAARSAADRLAWNDDLTDREKGPREGFGLPGGSSLGGELASLLRGVLSIRDAARLSLRLYSIRTAPALRQPGP